MNDIVLDTNLLSDFIAAYYSYDVRNNGIFKKYENINSNLVQRFNDILNNYRNYGTLQDGLVISSAFAFVEIARKFDLISKNRFTKIQFKAFIDSPPSWFSIQPVNNELFIYLQELPNSVVMDNGDSLPIEWADAIHVATALSRGENCLIAATDSRIIRIPSIKNRLIIQN